MTQNAHVPAREPVSDVMREPARLGLKLQPGTPPPSARFLCAAFDESVDPLEQVEEPRRRIALDTTITLGAEQAGERLVPRAVHRAERVIAPCFTLCGVPHSFVPRAFRRLAFFCGGGTPASSPKTLANLVRDGHIRRGDGADYPGLVRCHNFAPGASAGTSTPGEPRVVTELTPSTQEHTIAPFLNLHTTPAGGR